MSETDNEMVERKEGIFSSEEEMVSFLESRLATGRVYGLMGSVESYWYEVEGELETVEETPANGFYLIESKKRVVRELYDSYEEWLIARGGKTSQPVRDEQPPEE